MASSQIEFASGPYDHVLRDHNRRIRDRERDCNSKARFSFQRNFDELVRDHLNNCWGSNEEMSCHTFGLKSVGKNEGNVKGENETQVLDRWAARQAREMMTTIERQTHKAELLALSNSQTVSERASTFLTENSPAQTDLPSSGVPNLRASSLVQMWKEFEAEATTPKGNQSGNLSSNSNNRYKRLNSIKSNNENSPLGQSPRGSEADGRFDSPEAAEHTSVEWEPEPATSMEQRVPVYQRQSSDSSEGGRVADIVKKLTSGSQTAQSSFNSSCNENEMDIDQEQAIMCDSSSSIDHSDNGEQKDFKFNNKKRLRLRGRQATKDLFMQMQQERGTEISKLAECHTVSQFPHRGRIQALLRIKFLQRGAAVQDQHRPASRTSELDQLHKRSSIFYLRERFSSCTKENVEASVADEVNVQNCSQVQKGTQDPSNSPVMNATSSQTHTQILNSSVLLRDNLPTQPELKKSTQDVGKSEIMNEDKSQTYGQLANANILNTNAQLLDTVLDLGNAPVLNKDSFWSCRQVREATPNTTNVPVLIEVDLQIRTHLPNTTQDPGVSGTSEHLVSQEPNHEDATTCEHRAQTVTEDHSLPSASEHGGQTATVENLIPSKSEHDEQTNHHSVISTSKYVQKGNRGISDIAHQNLCVDNRDSNGYMDNERRLPDLQGDTITEEALLKCMQHMESLDSWETITQEPDSSTLHQVESTAVSWLKTVSCPPRGWESHRPTWYDEGHEDSSDNEEINSLFERRTVSNLLGSSFRDRMDRLLLAHLKRHPEIYGDVEQEDSIEHCYQDVGNDPDQVDSPSLQLPLPSRLGLWNHYQDHETSDESDHVGYGLLQQPRPSSCGYQEISDDSDHVSFRSMQQHQPPSSGYQDSQQCSPFTNHQSLEMELIYDLKGHIERLQYEMSELRDSVKSCVGMQVNFQDTLKQEIAAAVCHSMNAVRGGETMGLSDSIPKRKRNCCICCSVQVDSLLYRCGHMCTCFKCAHELQWKSSKCPICRAPIVDVVRAFSDS